VAPIPDESGEQISAAESSLESSLDPSAQARVTDSQSSEVTVKIPTEEEKLEAAQPYIKELTSLLKNLNNQITALGEDAVEEYLSIAPLERESRLSALIEKYKPKADQLIKGVDPQAEKIFIKMTSALAAIGADDSIVGDARNAYEREISGDLDHLDEVLSQLGQ
jgi:hypothetical protein